MDAAGFSTIVALNRRRLVGYARTIVGYDRGEDVVQTALLHAWERCQRGDEIREPLPWLFRIVRNTAITVATSAAVRHEAERIDRDLPAREDLAAHVEARDELCRALTAIRELPDRQGAAILRSADGLAPRMIARELGLTSGAVRMLLLRGRTEIRGRCPA